MSDLQRTEEWFSDRLGRATASRFNDIMTEGKNGYQLAGWKNYKVQLVLERITGQRQDTYQSKEMLWGTETEPLARLYYQLATGNTVEEVGFLQHKTLQAGASPDGLIGEDGGLEIKCPNSATHLEVLHTGQVPKIYIPQVQGGMWISGRKWWDFVSFDPRMPETAKQVIIRVERDEEYIAQLETKVTKFLAEVDEEMHFLNSYGMAQKETKDATDRNRKTKSIPSTVNARGGIPA